jgi:hypothetical protein
LGTTKKVFVKNFSSTMKQGVEKCHERRADKAKFGEKAQFVCDK